MSGLMLMPLEVGGGYMMRGGPMMGGYGHHYYGGGFLMLLLPLFLLLVLFLLLRRAKRTGRPVFGTRENWVGPSRHADHSAAQPGPAGAGADPHDEALRTLANRLAAGDIDPEDYRQRVDTLRSTRDRTAEPAAGTPFAEQEGQPPRNDQPNPPDLLGPQA